MLVNSPLYSRKLHILWRLFNASCVTSWTILALALDERVMYHLANLNFPANVQMRKRERAGVTLILVNMNMITHPVERPVT